MTHLIETYYRQYFLKFKNYIIVLQVKFINNLNSQCQVNNPRYNFSSLTLLLIEQKPELNLGSGQEVIYSYHSNLNPNFMA
jgi:hypothetical protein